MRLQELVNILKATGYPVAYSHFKSRQKPPFICYKETGTNNFKADNMVFKKIPLIDVELYTTDKDLVAESNLESVLKENNIPWEAIETYIESEKVFQRIYEITLI